MTEEDRLLTLADVSGQTGYTQRRLRQLAEKGVLKAELLGKTYVVRESALTRFLSEHRPKTGRPRGSKNRPQPDPAPQPDDR